MSNVDIQEWTPDFKKIKSTDDCWRMILLAKSKCGKTVLVEHLYKKQFKNIFDVVAVFSKTSVNRYSEVIHTNSVKGLFYDDYNEAALLAIIEKQKELLKTTKKKDMPRVLLIFDDVADHNLVKNSKVMNDLFTLGRHQFICTLFITQYHTMVTTTWKANSDYLMFGRVIDGVTKEHLIVNWLKGHLPESTIREEYKQLNEIITRNTLNYQFLVLDTGVQSYELDKILFRYKVMDKKYCS